MAMMQETQKFLQKYEIIVTVDDETCYNISNIVVMRRYARI